MQRTFSIIKPDAMRKGLCRRHPGGGRKGGVQDCRHQEDVSCPKDRHRAFTLSMPSGRFSTRLTTFMSSGSIIAMVLEKENAIADLRKLMGATNPADAAEGTIRKQFASSIEENAMHGSDAEDTAAFEIGYFFAGYELI